MKSLVFTPILFFLFSCGLDSVNYLNNPTVISQTENSILKWQYIPGNYSGTNFQGYELFYKFYVENVSINYGLNDENSLSTNNGVEVVPTPERLLSLGYQRLNLSQYTMNIEPLVSINVSDLGTTINYELTFSNLINATIDVKVDNPPFLIGTENGTGIILTNLEIRRGARNSAGTEFRRFWEVYDSVLRGTQPNLEPSLTTALTSSPPAIWVVAFIMAYGWSPENGREISEPVLLGTVKTMTLNWP